MKNNFNLTFKSDNKSYTICLPHHYEKLMNVAYCTSLGENGMQTLCQFCNEYENLGKAKQAKLQQIIDCGLITFKLKTFYDLLALACTIDGFRILKGVATPKHLADYIYDGDCDAANITAQLFIKDSTVFFIKAIITIICKTDF